MDDNSRQTPCCMHVICRIHMLVVLLLDGEGPWGRKCGILLSRSHFHVAVQYGVAWPCPTTVCNMKSPIPRTVSVLLGVSWSRCEIRSVSRWELTLVKDAANRSPSSPESCPGAHIQAWFLRSHVHGKTLFVRLRYSLDACNTHHITRSDGEIGARSPPISEMEEFSNPWALELDCHTPSWNN